ncbi:MAG: hypothetical protein KC457_30425, partial [Myxococcales bacterium]|nr:hypothetical protein [Myxococcales bacterium]
MPTITRLIQEIGEVNSLLSELGKPEWVSSSLWSKHTDAVQIATTDLQNGLISNPGSDLGHLFDIAIQKIDSLRCIVVLEFNQTLMILLKEERSIIRRFDNMKIRLAAIKQSYKANQEEHKDNEAKEKE